MLNSTKEDRNQHFMRSAMTAKSAKPTLADWDPNRLPDLSKEEAEAEFSRFMATLEKEYGVLPDEVLNFGAQRVVDFIQGKLSWAEIFNIPKEMIKQMVEYGYLQFQMGRYEEAERFFKVLTVLDWNNSAYHSMMGSILQRQKRFGEAIASYTEALRLNPTDAVSLTNRAEIYFAHGVLEKADADCDQVLMMTLPDDDKWKKRAQLIKVQIIEKRKQGLSEEKGK